MTSRFPIPKLRAAALMTGMGLLMQQELLAQGVSPWLDAIDVLENAFTGPLARGLSLISIVIGGLMFAFGEGGSKKALAGIIFGLGLAMGAAHEWLWRALRGKGIKVQVVAIGLDFDDTIRSETALKRWSKGAGKQVEQIVEGQTQDDPDVKAEMQLIENAILKVDTRFMAKYGGVQGASKRFIALRSLPKSKVEPEAAIDSYEIWVSSRLRMLDVDL